MDSAFLFGLILFQRWLFDLIAVKVKYFKPDPLIDINKTLLQLKPNEINI